MSDAIDPRNNPESRQAEEGASQTRQQSSESGPVVPPAPRSGQSPEARDAEAGIPAGTAQGDPLAGVKASEQDSAEAVSGDTGPEHSGARRDSRGGPA